MLLVLIFNTFATLVISAGRICPAAAVSSSPPFVSDVNEVALAPMITGQMLVGSLLVLYDNAAFSQERSHLIFTMFRGYTGRVYLLISFGCLISSFVFPVRLPQSSFSIRFPPSSKHSHCLPCNVMFPILQS